MKTLPLRLQRDLLEIYQIGNTAHEPQGTKVSFRAPLLCSRSSVPSDSRDCVAILLSNSTLAFEACVNSGFLISTGGCFL